MLAGRTAPAARQAATRLLSLPLLNTSRHGSAARNNSTSTNSYAGRTSKAVRQTRVFFTGTEGVPHNAAVPRPPPPVAEKSTAELHLHWSSPISDGKSESCAARRHGGLEGWGGAVDVGHHPEEYEEEEGKGAPPRVVMASLAPSQVMKVLAAKEQYRVPRAASSSQHARQATERSRAAHGGHSEPAGGGRVPKNNSGKANSVITATNAIILLNVAMFMVQEHDPSFTARFYKLAPAILEGEWYRLVTPIALHGSWTHCGVNSLSFFSYGNKTEADLGTTKFLMLYICSGVAGNALSCIVNPMVPSLGASGAIFGLAGAETMRHLIGPSPSVKLFVVSLAETAFFAFVVAMVVPNIDHMGHLGGFLGGGVLMLLLRPR